MGFDMLARRAFPRSGAAAAAWYLVLFCAPAGWSQTISGRYVVELSGPPAMRDTTRRAAVRQQQNAARRAIEARGATVRDTLDTVVNGLIVSVPDARAAELAALPGVVRVHPVQHLNLLLDHALPLHRVPAAWAALPLGQSGAGAGVKIGIIDTGIDVNHAAFSDPLPPVAGFPKVRAASDIRYTNAKIIVARNYTTLLSDGGEPDADDHMGHGTGTSMAAAGGAAVSPYGPISGVAPKAYIGNYKVSDANGSSTDVIAKAVDDAVADGMDVINISLGGFVTSYSDVDPNSLAIAALEGAANAGVVVTVSAGNDGPGAGTIQNLATAPDVIAVGAIMNDRTMGYAVRVSGADPYAAVPGTGPTPGKAAFRRAGRCRLVRIQRPGMFSAAARVGHRHGSADPARKLHFRGQARQRSRRRGHGGDRVQQHWRGPAHHERRHGVAARCLCDPCRRVGSQSAHRRRERAGDPGFCRPDRFSDAHGPLGFLQPRTCYRQRPEAGPGGRGRGDPDRHGEHVHGRRSTGPGATSR